MLARLSYCVLLISQTYDTFLGVCVVCPARVQPISLCQLEDLTIVQDFLLEHLDWPANGGAILIVELTEIDRLKEVLSTVVGFHVDYQGVEVDTLFSEVTTFFLEEVGNVDLDKGRWEGLSLLRGGELTSWDNLFSKCAILERDEIDSQGVWRVKTRVSCWFPQYLLEMPLINGYHTGMYRVEAKIEVELGLILWPCGYLHT